MIRYVSSYRSLLCRLKFQPLQDICMIRQLLLCHRYIYKTRNFPVDLVCSTRTAPLHLYNLRRRGHPLQLYVPDTSRLSSLPIFTAFKVWNCFDIDSRSVLLNYADFKLHMKYAGISRHICAKLPSVFASIDSL